MSAPNIITQEEVSKHNKNNDLWMTIHNSVYDVTAFLKEHPGGEDALLEYAGKEATTAFEDVGHSSDARELMKKYKVGDLEVATVETPEPSAFNYKEYIPHAIAVFAVGIALGFLAIRLSRKN